MAISLAITGPLSTTVGSTVTYTAAVMDGQTVVAANVAATWTVGSEFTLASAGQATVGSPGDAVFVKATFTHNSQPLGEVVYVTSVAASVTIQTVVVGWVSAPSSFAVGDSSALTAAVHHAGGSNETITAVDNPYFTWTVSAAAHGSVVKNGSGNALLRGNKTGSVTVSVAAKAGISITGSGITAHTVAVTDKLLALVVQPPSMTAALPQGGGTKQASFTVSVRKRSVLDGALITEHVVPSSATWSVPGAQSYAAVNSSGVMTMSSAGSTYMTVSAQGKQIKIPVTVLPAPASSSPQSGEDLIAKYSASAYQSMAIPVQKAAELSQGTNPFDFDVAAQANFAAQTATFLTKIGEGKPFHQILSETTWDPAFARNRLDVLIAAGTVPQEYLSRAISGEAGANEAAFGEKFHVAALDAVQNSRTVWASFAAIFGEDRQSIVEQGFLPKQRVFSATAPQPLSAGVFAPAQVTRLEENKLSQDSSDHRRRRVAQFDGALDKTSEYLDAILASGRLDPRLRVLKAREQAQANRAAYIQKIEQRLAQIGLSS
jgi:hypothetical protein